MSNENMSNTNSVCHMELTEIVFELFIFWPKRKILGYEVIHIKQLSHNPPFQNIIFYEMLFFIALSSAMRAAQHGGAAGLSKVHSLLCTSLYEHVPLSHQADFCMPNKTERKSTEAVETLIFTAT